ncbi:hypothetical protein Tco_0896154, partial [Tanacetum coccineum]
MSNSFSALNDEEEDDEEDVENVYDESAAAETLEKGGSSSYMNTGRACFVGQGKLKCYYIRTLAVGGQYIANSSCVSATNTPYGSATGNAEAAHSPYSNELQSLNATFSLGAITPTTLTEAVPSVAGDVITELPHTG